MRPSIAIRIPQPCHESWAAMTPTGTGRHCAACQQTVVDFTLKSDAEILAYLASAANSRACGRFAAGQLERPLQRAAPAAPTRWRAWLAAAVAVWGLREGIGVSAKAQSSTEWHSHYWGGPVPALVQPVQQAAQNVSESGLDKVDAINGKAQQEPADGRTVLRGVVTDARTGDKLPGVTILVPGTTIGTSTDLNGAFELAVPAPFAKAKRLKLSVSYIGYRTQEKTIKQKNVAATHVINLKLEVMVLGELALLAPPPATWYPRNIYDWGKEWLNRASGRS